MLYCLCARALLLYHGPDHVPTEYRKQAADVTIRDTDTKQNAVFGFLPEQEMQLRYGHIIDQHLGSKGCGYTTGFRIQSVLHVGI